MEFKISTVQFLCSVTKCLGILIWVTTSTVVGALLVTAGEMITWLELDDDNEPCSYHGKPLLTVKEFKKNER